ncbi:MAG: pantetheine-phosphate adenylyltransferase [Planctomycetes bacterium]|jgi:pantetheine-phosphate adenylyltransferase|nr:pantetheine-phosphate adenylyltransferase [Planctomycetota bacterium]
MKTAVYPGTFDPITYGHTDIIERGAKMFDKLIVAVAENPAKKPLFSVDERLDMLRRLTAHIPNVCVDNFDGLTVDYVRSVGANIILRGMRTMSDFEYEFQLALSNKALCNEVDTVFLMTSVERSFLSSHRIKEVASMGVDVSPFVPDIVRDKLNEKLAPGESKA